jgi:putative oxidoreductase
MKHQGKIAMAIGLLLLRITLGLTLAAHGAQKLFGWFGGLGPDGTAQGLAALGFHPGRRHALAAGFVETTAGLLLAFGLLTPLAAAASLSVMIVAAVSVHLRHGFFIMDNGVEYYLVFGHGAITLAFTGPSAVHPLPTRRPDSPGQAMLVILGGVSVLSSVCRRHGHAASFRVRPDPPRSCAGMLRRPRI